MKNIRKKIDNGKEGAVTLDTINEWTLSSCAKPLFCLSNTTSARHPIIFFTINIGKYPEQLPYIWRLWMAVN